jgi:hypothetical protein
MKQITIRGYVRAFTATTVAVEDDFDPDDSEAVQNLWYTHAKIDDDIIELLECSLEVGVVRVEVGGSYGRVD